MSAMFVNESCVKPTLDLQLALYSSARRGLRSVDDDIAANLILAFLNVTYDISSADFVDGTFKFACTAQSSACFGARLPG